MKYWKWSIPAAAALAAASAHAGGVNMQPGLWKIVTKTTISGLPFQVPANTHSTKQCITAEQLAKPWKRLQNNKDCRITNLHSDGNGASWKVECTGEAKAQGTAQLTVDSPTAYHARIDMTTSEGGKAMHTHSELTGRRVGNCTGKH